MKKLSLSSLLCTILCFFLWPAHAQTITTIAGLGYGFNGDGIAATAVNLEHNENAVVTDAHGNLFFTDYNQGRVRKLSASGTVTTVVGEGTHMDWWSMTGGPATAARTPWLRSLALDNNGNIIIGSEAIIWKLDTTGYLSVVAGNGIFGDAGDGGMATDANIMTVPGLAVDRIGNIYFTDNNAHKIRKIDTSGIITTIAGDGTSAFSGDGGAATAAQLSWPNGIAVTAGGEIVFCDEFNYRVRKINTSGVISTIAGNDTAGFSGDGGSATAAKINRPYGVMIDSSGNILFADAGNNRVRKISGSGIISTVFGNGSASFCGDGGSAAAACINPATLCSDAAGNIYIDDAANNRIRKINTSGTISTVVGHTSHANFSGDGGTASAAELNRPSSVVADNYGNTYIADAGNNRIRKINTSGIITTFAGISTGGHSGDGGPATAARINVSRLTVDSVGNVYFTEDIYIRKISTSGVISTIAGGGTSTADGVAATAADIQPKGICSDALGNLYFTDGNRVRLLNTSGVITTVGGSVSSGYSGDGGPATAATFDGPSALALDHFHNLFVCDNNNHAIRKISPSGTVINAVGGGRYYTHCPSCYYMMADGTGIDLPTTVAVDEYGNIYFSDLSSNTVSRIDTFGVLHKLAGIDGNQGYLGDGGQAHDAHLYGVSGLAVDQTGHLLIAEEFNSTVRSVSLCTGVPAMTGSSSDPRAICLGDSALITRRSGADDFTWSCADTTITLNLFSRGRGEVNFYATGRAAGIANVIITARDICGSSSADTIRINVGGSLAGTAVIPHTICVGSSAVCTDTFATGSWYSSAPSVASISATGTLTGVASGTTVISFLGTSSCGSGIDTQTVVVLPAVSAGTISGSASICVGSTATLTATATGGIWTSSAAAVASVSATGVVYGVAAGTASISYSVTGTCGSAVATHTITVNPLPSAGTISGGTSVCVSATLSLSSSVTGGTWVSATPSIASVNTSGTVTGIMSGTATLYYIVSGACGADTARTTLTVNSLPTAGTITGSAGICVGANTSLTSSGTGGTWTTSAATVASINTAGVAYGIAAGTATISYTVSSTCGTSTATYALSVFALPTVSIAASSSCGGNTALTGSGATSYSWSPSTGLSCTVCTTASAAPTATTSYILTGTNSDGCVDTAAITVNGNRISGHITFSAAAPDTLDTKVWLIQFSASDSSITATDSTTTCLDAGVPYFEFMNKPTGNYMVKGKLLYGNVPGASGYLPTYSDSTINWYAARVATHTSGTDNLNIKMLYGTVPAGIGFIGGSVVSGAGKGTAGEVPETGMMVYLKDATGNVLTYVYTDAAGNYSFSGLAFGTYYIYPADFSYYTTPSAAITLSASTPSVTGVKFKKYTTSGIIIPLETTGLTNLNATGSNIAVFPNPTNGELTITWNKAISGEANFTITDVVGRVVYSNNWNLAQSTSYHEQLPTLVTGTYHVTITSSDLYYNGKLMVQQ